MPPRWSVYILECFDGTFYTGCTTNIVDRVFKHNKGRGAKYTRGRLPVTLVYREDDMTRGAAQRREAQIKKLSRKEKELLIG